MQNLTRDGREIGLPGYIPLATRTGRAIPNVQDPDMPPWRIEQYLRRFRKLFPRPELRRGPTGRYNCHGMTFASRRTQILAPDSRETITEIVMNILGDDGYREIRLQEAMQGDVVVYYDGNEISHTGIIVEIESDDRVIGGRAVKVMSKWGPGGEYLHYVNECPDAGTPGKKATYWTDRDG